MRIPDLDRILSAMLKTYTGISDLNFSVGHPLQVEDFGELKPVYVDPPIEALTPHQTEQVALTLMQGNRRLIYDYLTGGSCDSSYSLGDEARFRVNIFRQQGHFSVVLRKLQSEVPTNSAIGAAGNLLRDHEGKNRTCSGHGRDWQRQDHDFGGDSQRDLIRPNRSMSSPSKTRSSTFTQRAKPPSISANSDTILIIIPPDCAPLCVRPPKVILVGEMRDRATVEIAMMAAETGHLVLSTLHTVDAGQSINRILGLFSLGEEQQLRIRWRIRFVTSSASASPQGRRWPPTSDRDHGSQFANARRQSRSAKANTAASTKSSKPVRRLVG